MRRILLFALLLVACIPMNAQTEQELVETQRSFFETVYWLVFNSNEHQSYIYYVDNKKQEVINGHTYIPIYFDDSVDDFVVGYLREEGKRVYFVHEGEQEEWVLYDFGLQAGESIDVGLGKEHHQLTVAEVDTIYIDLKPVRRLRMTDPDIEASQYERPAYWIEGIGSDLGPLYQYGWGKEHAGTILDHCGSSLMISYADLFEEAKDFSFVAGSPYWRFTESNPETRSWRWVWFYIPEESHVSLKHKDYHQLFYGVVANSTYQEEVPATYLFGVREENGVVYVNLDEYKEALRKTGLGDAENIPYRVTEDGEMVLYDFNMQEGDRFASVAGHEDLYVKSVTSDPYYGRKMFTMSNNVTCTEGSGAVRSPGLLIAYLNPADYGFSRVTLSAYGRNGVYREYDSAGGTTIIDKPDIPLWIENVTKSEHMVSPSLYDLSGRCAKNGELHKGVYIQNGKKFVVK